MLYPARARRKSVNFFETLENRRLLSLTVDVRLAPGSSPNINSVGQVVNLEIWANAKGSNGTGTDEGLHNLAGSILSANVASGAAKGTLNATLLAPFNGMGSSSGQQNDLDGDGDLDVGNTDPAANTAQGIFYARSNNATTTGGTVSSTGRSFKIATATFTVTQLLSTSGSTELTFVPHISSAFNGTNAVWREDGQIKADRANNDNGTYAGGTTIILKRGSGGGGGGGSTPGSIAGNVFNDTNNNGVKNTGESNLAGWRVYIDSDKDGIMDSTEPKTLTDASGNYSFSNLGANNTYRVRAGLAPGYHYVNPSTGFVDVALGSGTSATGKNFAISNSTGGSTTNGSISGNVFKDSNGNGVKDSGEVGLSGWRVYVDWDRNGIYNTPTDSRTVLTDASGNYKLPDLSPNVNRRVRVVPASGYTIKSPSSGYYDITLTTGQNLTGKNFATVTGTPTTGATISGSIFNDIDSDKIRDSGEAGIANWRVFLDADGDNTFDSGEKNVLSDSSGNYTFTGLAAGTYNVRVQPITTNVWTRTTAWPSAFSLASGQTKSGVLFGYHKS